MYIGTLQLIWAPRSGPGASIPIESGRNFSPVKIMAEVFLFNFVYHTSYKLQSSLTVSPVTDPIFMGEVCWWEGGGELSPVV